MIKERLQAEHGSLRNAAAKSGINYYRLSQIVNGWVKPKDEEKKVLKITDKEIKEITKIKEMTKNDTAS